LKYWLFISFVIPVNLNEKHVRPIRGSALVHISLEWNVNKSNVSEKGQVPRKYSMHGENNRTG